jgi:hypothetical protein
MTAFVPTYKHAKKIRSYLLYDEAGLTRENVHWKIKLPDGQWINLSPALVS